MEQSEISTENPINGKDRPIEAIGQPKKTRSKPGLEGSLEQLTLFQDEINRIELTDEDLKDLINPESSRTKWQKFYDKFKELMSGIGVDTNNIKHIRKIIAVFMIPPLFSHTLAIGGIIKEDRNTYYAWIAYAGAFFFALLFEFAEHIIGKFKNKYIAHIGSIVIGLASYVLSMVGWHDFYTNESNIFGIKHLMGNILSLIPPIAIYAFTAQLVALEREAEKRKQDKLKSGKEKKPYSRVKKFTKPQIENFLYELMANPNQTHAEFSEKYPDVGSSKFDQIKAAARKKLREHQTNKQKKK